MNLSSAYLARRYALAFLYVYGKEIKEVDFLAFRQVHNFLVKHPDALTVFTFPGISTDDLDLCVKKLIKKFSLIPTFERLLELLLTEQRILLLRDVIQYIIWEYQVLQKKPLFTITSSHQLPDDEKSVIASFLSNQLEGAMMSEYKIDASLIAGIRIMSDSLLWEYSIRRQLNKAYKSLTA